MLFIKSTGRILGFILLGIAFIAAPMAIFKLGLLPPLQLALGLSKPSPFVSPPGMLLAMVLGYWAYVRIVERRAVTELWPRPGQALSGVAAAIVLIGAPVLVLYALGYYQVLSYQGIQGLWGVAPTILTAAVLEELVFRGLIFSVLERQTGTVAALLAQSVIFAAPHMSNEGFGGLIDFVAGVLIGGMWTCLYVLWRNIWSIAFHHAVWNLTIIVTGLPLSGLEDFKPAAAFHSTFAGPALMTGGDAGPEGSVVTLAVVTVALGVLFWVAWRRQSLRPAVSVALKP